MKNEGIDEGLPEIPSIEEVKKEQFLVQAEFEFNEASILTEDIPEQ